MPVQCTVASLVPRLSRGEDLGEKRAWYTPFVHALTFYVDDWPQAMLRIVSKLLGFVEVYEALLA